MLRFCCEFGIFTVSLRDCMGKIIVAITGASGSIYAWRLIEKLSKGSFNVSEIAVVFSENGQRVWDYELGKNLTFDTPLKQYPNSDMFAPMASGSAGYGAMVIVPCSMGTLGRIASGTSNDLIGRAADVMLKENRKLILVPRELPYNQIHLGNMLRVAQAGATILPASPSFYSHPKNINDVVDTIVDRIIDQLGFDAKHFRWGE